MSKESLYYAFKRNCSFSVQALTNLARCQMFAAGVTPEEFMVYTGLTRHYERYKEAGERMARMTDFDHVPKVNKECV